MGEDLLACPVCLQTFDDPHLLSSCGHTFCRKCILALSPRACPTCRAPIAPDGFQVNFALRMVLRDLQASGSATPQPSAPPPEVRAGAQWFWHRKRQITSTTNALAGAGAFSVVRQAGGAASAGAQREAWVAAELVAAELVELGMPWGLARLVSEEDAQVALRIFLLDNSGSTSVCDGRVLEGGRMADCTRWEETRHMALEQAKWNARVGTPCEFLLLNSPAGRQASGRGFQQGVDFIRIDPRAGCVDEQCVQLEAMLRKVQPCGQTPLVSRLREIYRRIQLERDALAQAGQRVVLVIATDGEPSEPRSRLVEVIRQIALDLPVHMVIRLTTNEDSVVEFYNQLDEELEIPLEVLDDIESEAKEIACRGNGWLTYSPLMHRLREMGTFVKLFDLLDERALTATEAMVLARLLLQTEDSADHPPRVPLDFCRFAKDRLQILPKVYDPIARRMGPCINVQALSRRLVPLSRRLSAVLEVLCCGQPRVASVPRAG